MTARVAIVSARFGAAQALEAALTPAGFEVALATRDDDALALARRDACDLVILHVDRTALDLLDLCPRIKAVRPDLSVLAISPEADPSLRLRALDTGADEVAGFGVEAADLVLRASSVAALTAARAESRRMASLSSLPGEEPTRSRARVLVIDPNERSRSRVAEILATEFSVTAHADPSRGLVGAAEGSFEAAWVAVDGPGCEGLRLAAQLRLVDPAGALRMLAIADVETNLPHRILRESAVDDLVRRPVDRCEVLARTRVAVARRLLAQAERARVPAASIPIPSRFRQPSRRLPGRFAA